MNLTFPVADWLFGTSDLDRSLMGYILNSYSTKHLKAGLNARPNSSSTRRRPIPWQQSEPCPQLPPVKLTFSLSVLFLVALGVYRFEQSLANESLASNPTFGSPPAWGY